MERGMAALTSATGNINKAYLLVRKEVILENNKNGKEVGLSAISGITALNASLQNNLSNVTDMREKASSLIGIDSSIANSANEKGYLPIKVQYNPASITFSGLKGHQGMDGHDGAYMEFNRPVETTMSMELIFDTMDIQKSFMLSQTGKDIARGLLRENASVRPIVELLIAATVFTSTRWIGFAWNKTLFWGELVSVNATYTMFDKEGEPVRAKVGIRIRQDQVNITDLQNNDEGEMNRNRIKSEEQWKAQFNALGKKEARINVGISNIWDL